MWLYNEFKPAVFQREEVYNTVILQYCTCKWTLYCHFIGNTINFSLVGIISSAFQEFLPLFLALKAQHESVLVWTLQKKVSPLETQEQLVILLTHIYPRNQTICNGDHRKKSVICQQIFTFMQVFFSFHLIFIFFPLFSPCSWLWLCTEEISYLKHKSVSLGFYCKAMQNFLISKVCPLKFHRWEILALDLCRPEP